jgi:hypothetical protein
MAKDALFLTSRQRDYAYRLARIELQTATRALQAARQKALDTDAQWWRVSAAEYRLDDARALTDALATGQDTGETEGVYPLSSEDVERATRYGLGPNGYETNVNDDDA